MTTQATAERSKGSCSVYCFLDGEIECLKVDAVYRDRFLMKFFGVYIVYNYILYIGPMQCKHTKLHIYPCIAYTLASVFNVFQFEFWFQLDKLELFSFGRSKQHCLQCHSAVIALFPVIATSFALIDTLFPFIGI